eukprot:CAMPEP_0170524174 /NCGR_PEP_ID=MMETSP0209-20121228/9585_1 /TAXON_ID=665100 ORGANISM="Litonotus pictus, Strain P1" /NCGR_SAMPLE_ID=MMETSP0209 /ASSEMBLY_ACC=CAM_ASM_000301 /LENGTH=239 /DNA_ID=CAMNT_0010812685 /DNA_START=1050 /DNA_END=1766 /DNA_ORIENTATION=-
MFGVNSEQYFYKVNSKKQDIGNSKRIYFDYNDMEEEEYHSIGDSFYFGDAFELNDYDYHLINSYFLSDNPNEGSLLGLAEMFKYLERKNKTAMIGRLYKNVDTEKCRSIIHKEGEGSKENKDDKESEERKGMRETTPGKKEKASIKNDYLRSVCEYLLLDLREMDQSKGSEEELSGNKERSVDTTIANQESLFPDITMINLESINSGNFNVSIILNSTSDFNQLKIYITLIILNLIISL